MSKLTTDGCAADFTAVIDGKEYNITIEQQENDDD